MVVGINPRYKHLTQKENFCGPACLQMILLRRGIWHNQELLAKKIGVGINKKDRDLYILEFPEFTGRDSRIGVTLKELEKEKFNKFLKKFRLKSKVFRPSKMKNVPAFIAENLKTGNDIMVNFFWEPINKRKYGHFVLIADINPETEEITVCDPSPRNKSFWKIKLEKFLKGMDKKWDGDERGFVVIKDL